MVIHESFSVLGNAAHAWFLEDARDVFVKVVFWLIVGGCRRAGATHTESVVCLREPIHGLGV